MLSNELANVLSPPICFWPVRPNEYTVSHARDKPVLTDEDVGNSTLAGLLIEVSLNIVTVFTLPIPGPKPYVVEKNSRKKMR